MTKPQPLPSGMTQEQLREACDAAIAAGQNILVQPGDLLAILVSLDLRQRLDDDVVMVEFKRRMRRLNALALILFLATLAYLTWSKITYSKSQSTEHRLTSAMARLPVFHEDTKDELKPAHIQAVARAIEKASKTRPPGVSRPDWQALLVSVGFWESTFSMRIHRGDCKKHECDAGRARSPWQMHRNAFTAPVWDKLFGIEHVDLQAQTASDMLKRSFNTCARSGVPWVAGTLNAYAGRRCGDESWGGLGDRLLTFQLVRARL